MQQENSPQRTASNVVRHWKTSANRPSSANALAEHSSYRHDRSFVVDLAYAEYCLRVENGEHLDPTEYAEQFAPFDRFVLRQIEIHDCLQDVIGDYSPPLPDNWPVPGDTFAHFKLLEELGRGGIARVFLAEDSSLADRRVVLKIAPKVAYEAEKLVRFDHPGISAVHSLVVSDDDKLSALCMPYHSRVTLADLIAHQQQIPRPSFQRALRELMPAIPRENEDHRRSPVDYTTDAEAVIRFGQILARAVEHAHSRGVLHLDLKPSNILLRANGSPVLIDFNLAADLQRVELLGGTLPYMAPEQLRRRSHAATRESVDERTDVFAIGLILYELSTGAHPICESQANSSTSWKSEELLVLQRAFSSIPASCDEVSDVGLRAIVRRCLQFSAADRYAAAATLATDLERELKLPKRTARVARMYPRRTMLGAVVSVGLIASLGAVVWRRDDPLVENARQAYREGRYNDCMAMMDDLFDTLPNLADVHRFRGFVRYRRGEFELAYEDFKQSQQLQPDARLYVMRGSCMAKTVANRSRISTAISMYRNAISNGQASPEVHNALGSAYKRDGNYGPAKNAFDQAIQIDDEYGLAYYNRTLVRLKMGEPPTAVIDDAVAAAERMDKSLPFGPHLAASMLAMTTPDDPAIQQRVERYLRTAIAQGADFAIDPFSVSEKAKLAGPTVGGMVVPSLRNQAVSNHEFNLFVVEELLPSP